MCWHKAALRATSAELTNMLLPVVHGLQSSDKFTMSYLITWVPIRKKKETKKAPPPNCDWRKRYLWKSLYTISDSTSLCYTDDLSYNEPFFDAYARGDTVCLLNFLRVIMGTHDEYGSENVVRNDFAAIKTNGVRKEVILRKGAYEKKSKQGFWKHHLGNWNNDLF